MAKRHGTNQTYDKYCYKYSQAHSDVASSAGVRELLTLNRIIHANFPRLEFGMVLDHAMRYHNSYVTTMVNIREGRRLVIQVVPIHSVRDTFSQFSRSRRYHAESSDKTTHEAQSRTGTHGAGDSSIVTADSSGVRLADTRADGLELVAFSQIQIDDTLRTILMAEEKLSEFASKLESASDQAEAAETAAASASALGNETLETLSTLLGKLAAAKMSATRARETFGSLSESVSCTDLTKARTDGAHLKHGAVEAMLSMESVRVALRRIDQGELAIQGANKNESREQGKHRQGPTPSETTYTRMTNKVKPVVSWECGGNHYASENPACKEKLRKKIRQRKGSAKGDSTNRESKSQTPHRGGGDAAPVTSSDTASGSSRLKTNVSEVFWGDASDLINTAMSLTFYSGATTDIKMAVNGEPHDGHYALIDDVAQRSVIGLPTYVGVANKIGVKVEVQPLSDGEPTAHAFGTSDNHSTPESIIGRAIIPIPVSRGAFVPASVLVVDGECGIIPLRPGLGGEAEATAREHAARRDARLQPFGRSREKGVAHWPVTRSRPVVHLRERPVTG